MVICQLQYIYIYIISNTKKSVCILLYVKQLFCNVKANFNKILLELTLQVNQHALFKDPVSYCIAHSTSCSIWSNIEHVTQVVAISVQLCSILSLQDLVTIRAQGEWSKWHIVTDASLNREEIMKNTWNIKKHIKIFSVLESRFQLGQQRMFTLCN